MPGLERDEAADLRPACGPCSCWRAPRCRRPRRCRRAPMASSPGIGLQHLRHVAEELADLAGALLAAVVEAVALVVLHHHRLRQERRQRVRAAIGADGRAAAALGRAEGLVQHEHAGVEAELARADLAHHAVEIGVVVEAEAAGLMHHAHPFLDVGIVDAHVVGVVDHQGGGAVGDRGLQRLDRGIAVLLQHQGHDLEAGGRGGGGVAGMRLDRGDDLVALLQLAARLVIGAGDDAMGVGGIGAAAGLEDELVHARELAQARSKSWIACSMPCSVSSGCSGWTSATNGRWAIASLTRALYFMVQVPNRLMPIMPSVSWHRCR